MRAYKLLYTMKRLSPLVLLACACVAPDLAHEPSVSAKIILDDPKCPSTGCGVNAGFVIGVYFGELNFEGLANPEGVKLVGFENLPAGKTKLVVKTNRVYAVGPLGGAVGGAALVGSRFMVQLNGETLPVEITEVHQKAQYWAKTGNGFVETYKFMYLPPNTSTWKPLCVSEPTLSAALKFDAVVFDKERFDAATKEVYVPSELGWFNIACLSGGAAKTFMMRHAIASSAAPSVVTSEDERQSLVDAWTANYCGDGYSFTSTGTHLLLRDDHQWIASSSPWTWSADDGTEVTSYEAVWGPDGAVCLNTPRRFGANEDWNKQWMEAIQDHCVKVRGTPLPRCSEDGAYPTKWADLGHILTANY